MTGFTFKVTVSPVLVIEAARDKHWTAEWVCLLVLVITLSLLFSQHRPLTALRRTSRPIYGTHLFLGLKPAVS